MSSGGRVGARVSSDDDGSLPPVWSSLNSSTLKSASQRFSRRVHRERSSYQSLGKTPLILVEPLRAASKFSPKHQPSLKSISTTTGLLPVKSNVLVGN